MRRITAMALAFSSVFFIATPSYAYAHDRVANPWFHGILDLVTLALITSPLWSAFFWKKGLDRRFFVLVGAVQLPAAAFAFIPIPDPVVHIIALTLGLGITISSVWFVQQNTAHATESSPTI